MVHRPDIMEILYDRLLDADKARILTSKELIDIETHKDGWIVKCADGTANEGSIVIGADGVHSQVRVAMRRLVLKESPTANFNDEKPYSMAYRSLFGTAKLIPGALPGRRGEAQFRPIIHYPPSWR